jgi:hypothetical protein
LKRNQEKVKHAVVCADLVKDVEAKHAEHLKYQEGEKFISQVPKWAEKSKKEKLCHPHDIVFTNLTPEEREGQTSKCGLCKWQTKVNEKKCLKNKIKKQHPAPPKK